MGTPVPIDVLFVGGGTVGHLAPGFAVADALRRIGATAAFATPGTASEAAWFPPGETRYRSAAPRLVRRPVPLALFAPRLVGAVVAATRLLARVRPRAVVALGGWPCVPLALAAWLRRVPLDLLASDERPGAAVRLLAPLARRVYLARAEARAALPARVHTTVVGPILRGRIGHGLCDPSRFGLVPGRLTLLVTGGSLGARALNVALSEGVLLAARADPSLGARIQVLHQVGGSGEGVEAAYRAARVPHRVVPFVADMDVAYATADLVVCRGGALTVQELEATRVPAVLVPYPHHADRQQYENARRLVAPGAAVLLDEKDLSPERVARDVVPLLLDHARRREMSARAPRSPRGGAGRVAADLVRSIGGRVPSAARDRGAPA